MLTSWIANQLGVIKFSMWSRNGSTLTRVPSPTPAQSPTPTPTKDKSGFKEKKNERIDPRKEQLLEQYDAFSSRFSAIEASLRQRASDLGTLPVKPEVAASIQTTRSDLAEANSALSQGNLDRAALRLKRVEEALKYLESL